MQERHRFPLVCSGATVSLVRHVSKKVEKWAGHSCSQPTKVCCVGTQQPGQGAGALTLPGFVPHAGTALVPDRGARRDRAGHGDGAAALHPPAGSSRLAPARLRSGWTLAPGLGVSPHPLAVAARRRACCRRGHRAAHTPPPPAAACRLHVQDVTPSTARFPSPANALLAPPPPSRSACRLTDSNGAGALSPTHGDSSVLPPSPPPPATIATAVGWLPTRRAAAAAGHATTRAQRRWRRYIVPFSSFRWCASRPTPFPLRWPPPPPRQTAQRPRAAAASTDRALGRSHWLAHAGCGGRRGVAAAAPGGGAGTLRSVPAPPR